jgi:hypothetical protein
MRVQVLAVWQEIPVQVLQPGGQVFEVDVFARLSLEAVRIFQALVLDAVAAVVPQHPAAAAGF